MTETPSLRSARPPGVPDGHGHEPHPDERGDEPPHPVSWPPPGPATPFSLPKGECKSCVPRQHGYFEGEENLFPAAWQPLKAYPHWKPAPWSVHNEGVPHVVFCRLCGMLWHVPYDRNMERYMPVPLPEGIDAALRVDGRLDDVLRLMAAGHRDAEGLIEAYFRHARLDHSSAVHGMLCILGASPLDRMTAQHVVRCLGVIANRGEHTIIRVPSLKPLVRLFDRDDVWGAEPAQAQEHDRDVFHEWGSAEQKSLTRSHLDYFVALALDPSGSLDHLRIRTGDQDRDALLAMCGERNRLSWAFSLLERAVVDQQTPHVLDALAELHHLFSRPGREWPTPAQIHTLVGLLDAPTPLTAQGTSEPRWAFIRNRIIGFLHGLPRYGDEPAELRRVADEALQRHPY